METYYSTQHPIGPGTYPKPEGNKVVEIHNFDGKTYCEELSRDIWGYITYEQPLAPDAAERWELIPDGVLWFPVTVSSRKHGGGLRVTSGQLVRAARRPADTTGDTKKMQFKTRYFGSWQEAQRIMYVIQSLDITAERVRMSVTQGEVKVYINGKYILNFGDDIVYHHSKKICKALGIAQEEWIEGDYWNREERIWKATQK